MFSSPLSSKGQRALALLAITAAPLFAAEPPPSATFKVQHAIELKELPAGAKKVEVWFWIPDDHEGQHVLDLSVTQAPATYELTRDPVNGHRYLHATVTNPKGPLPITTEFTVRRTASNIAIDPAKAGELTDAQRRLFASYLRRDEPNMETDKDIVARANEICGAETNVVKQARAIYDWLIDNSEHYSKQGAPKSSNIGSVKYCLANGGGSCTDQHSTFIAMARARGIPTRLNFGSRIQAKNEGKEHDPGYRCWVQYFVPNFGWVPMDISAGDTNPDQRDFYFSGLDERRVWFAEGRNLDLAPHQRGPRVNVLIGAYIEVDGKPFTDFTRKMTFTEIKAGTARTADGGPSVASR